jgi:putative ABC transport system permease protein
MFKNYFKIVTRNLWKNKVYTLINIIGLAFGIAAMVWAFQNYRYSFSYNNFHKDGQDIFRVLTKAEGGDNLKGVCPMPLAVAAKNDFLNIKETVRWNAWYVNIKAGQSESFASLVHFTDASFFDVFNFPLIKGSVNLNDNSGVLLTEEAAQRFFGNEDVIGKTLMFYSDASYKKPLTVTGVLKNPPINSSLQFEIITNMNNLYQQDGKIIKNDDWSLFGDAVFLKLANPSSAQDLNKAFNKYLPLVQNQRTDIKVTSFSLQPLSRVAERVPEVENNSLYPRPQDSATYGPLVLAILVLLSACLNFANTSVAQSNNRLKEMGIRKVMGSTRWQIMLQQLFECAVIVLLAIGLSIVLNNFWLPAFNAMFVFVDVKANYLGDYTLLGFLAFTLVAVTLIAGAYPSFYVSRFNPANIFRGSVKFGRNNLFSRVLLGFQIVISFITVIAGAAFSRNSDFQRSYDYGYDKANIIGINIQDPSAYIPVRDELNKISGIEAISGTTDHIGFGYRNIVLEAKGEKKETDYFDVGENYPDVMKLKLVAGRTFNKTGEGDYNKSILINEKLAFEFGWKPAEAIGQQIRKNDTSAYTVVGVLKDFTQQSLFTPMQPVAMCLADPLKNTQVIIRARPGSVNQVYDQVKEAWEKLYPAKPFIGYYQDHVAAESSHVNESVSKIFFWFAVISILLAATGMFALISLTIMKRMREIAIRKVVGASGSQIFKLVLKGYSWIFLLASCLGCWAGYALAKLLLNMIFSINAGVNISSITISFICVLVILGVTIGSKVWYAFRMKATEVLKMN